MLSLQLFRVEPTLGWGREQGFDSSVYSSSIGSVCVSGEVSPPFQLLLRIWY